MAPIDGKAAYGGGRVSAQRLAVAEAAAALPGAFTVDELTAAAQRVRSGIGTATVYRAVAALLDAGFLEAVGTREGSTLYLRCEHDRHHHHLVCTGCGAATETDCPLDAAALRAAADAGYVITSHEVAIYGLCPSCADADGAA